MFQNVGLIDHPPVSLDTMTLHLTQVVLLLGQQDSWKKMPRLYLDIEQGKKKMGIHLTFLLVISTILITSKLPKEVTGPNKQTLASKYPIYRAVFTGLRLKKVHQSYVQSYCRSLALALPYGAHQSCITNAFLLGLCQQSRACIFFWLKVRFKRLTSCSSSLVDWVAQQLFKPLLKKMLTLMPLRYTDEPFVLTPRSDELGGNINGQNSSGSNKVPEHTFMQASAKL